MKGIKRLGSAPFSTSYPPTPSQSNTVQPPSHHSVSSYTFMCTLSLSHTGFCVFAEVGRTPSPSPLFSSSRHLSSHLSVHQPHTEQRIEAHSPMQNWSLPSHKHRRTHNTSVLVFTLQHAHLYSHMDCIAQCILLTAHWHWPMSIHLLYRVFN